MERPNLIKHCTVGIYKSSKMSEITQLDVNDYVLSTWGEDIVTRCPGKNEVIRKLNVGVYNISCPADCTVSGKHWSVTGVKEYHLRKHLRLPKIKIDVPITILETIQAESIPALYPELTKGTVPRIENVDPSVLNVSPAKSVDWHATGSVLAWMLLLIVLLCGLGLGIYRYRATVCSWLTVCRKQNNVPVPQPYALVVPQPAQLEVSTAENNVV